MTDERVYHSVGSGARREPPGGLRSERTCTTDRHARLHGRKDRDAASSSNARCPAAGTL